ncbi:DNA-processing protein DprA [Microbacterium album]|uniref:DNA processing protein DprA n=1 Tax=Microbacterium album TaxID=2053191 RepID=A0A917MKZ6_9MICO|nr:DNA-processing protein DprA [Microbacterium album]GGH39411.1 DNA processing protein DprA [Microbacterium album]
MSAATPHPADLSRDPDLLRDADGLNAPVADRRALLLRLAWSVIAEPGDGVAGRLAAALGVAGALEFVSTARERALPPSGADVSARELAAALERWRPRLGARLLRDAVRAARRARLTVLIPEGELWPSRLPDLGPHAPFALWVRGDAPALARLERSIAIVGARAATPYGEHVAGMLAGELAERGVCVVSGGAYGVDGVSHRAALGAGGPTIAFVAGGADRVYPAAHAHLFARIAERGAVVSEVPPGVAPTKWRFLQRNRLIAAVSGATVVVEAGRRSGSLNTAGHAAALGRPLGAVPGPVTSATSEGSHRLLREFDAMCITSCADALELLGEWDEAAAPSGERTRPETIRVLDALAPRAWRDADEIARRSGLSLAEVQAQLGLLELDGRVESDPEGWRLAR